MGRPGLKWFRALGLMTISFSLECRNHELSNMPRRGVMRHPESDKELLVIMLFQPCVVGLGLWDFDLMRVAGNVAKCCSGGGISRV